MKTKKEADTSQIKSFLTKSWKQNNIKNYTYLNDNLYTHFPEILVLLVHQKRSLHRTQVGVAQYPV